MSRLIIKNLPQKITDEKLRAVFAKHGTITDLRLAFTKDGKFRGFGFVGYKDSTEATKAKEYLNKSMILNQKIVVEGCRDFQAAETVRGTGLKLNNKGEAQLSTEIKDKPKYGLSDSDFLKSKKSGEFSDDEGYAENNNSGTISQSQKKFTLRLQSTGVMPKLSETQVVEFFHPIKPSSIRIVKLKRKSQAIVTFQSQNHLEKALKFHGYCINGKTIKLCVVKQKSDSPSKHSENWKKIDNDKSKIDIEEICESGRLFVRNLAFTCGEDDLETLFVSHGPLSEIHVPIDPETKKNTGIGFVTFMFPEHAVKAFHEVDGTVFQGRMIHVLPARLKPEKDRLKDNKGLSSYKKEKVQKEKSTSQQPHNWNTLFIGTDAVAGAIAEKYNITKSEFLNSEEKESTAVRVALGETQIVRETRQFLLDSGICLDSFSQPNSARSKTVILAKNLPNGSTALELRNLFESHGELGRVLLAPSGVSAIIEFLEPSHARQAFVSLAYRKFHFQPLYLEWAPTDVFFQSYSEFKEEKTETKTDNSSNINSIAVPDDSATIFVKNLNFATTEEELKNHFCNVGEVLSCTVSRKKTHKKEEMLSMGYGFVQYVKKSDAEKALKNLQNSILDGHKLELKMSKRSAVDIKPYIRKKQTETNQTSSKILVRNVPFQANRKEITSIFKTFGELKSVRVPRKLNISGLSGTHRGFAFVDFVTKQDAEKAFQALCHSTHLYGRRLVLEWADTEEESVEQLRRKTAERFQGKSKKFKPGEEFEKSLSIESGKTLN